MRDDVIFNFSVLPDAEFSTELVAASQAIETAQPLEYRLGEKSLPHVTILQFPGRRSDAAAVWRRLAVVEVPPLHLRFHGLGFDRFRDWDVVWLRLKHCPELREIQRRSLDVLGPLEYVNGTRDGYEPHATLATWLKKERLPALPIPTGVLDRVHTGAVAALGISGPQFQFAECLYRRDT